MCAAAILVADLDAVIYGASLEDSKAIYASLPDAPRAMPIDSATLRAEVGRVITERRQPSRQCAGPEAAAVLRRYASKAS
jgi:tRNA(Arg) A34 adenosine deaminase TadA